MPNLGTKAGNLISSDGLIAGDVPKTAHVSDYAKFYGTYSGADIKVIVHYPQTITMDEQLALEKGRLEADLSEIERILWEKRNVFVSAEIANELNAQQALLAKLQRINNEIAEKSNVPQSKVLAELQTISISSYRETGNVRTLGSVYPRGYTVGPRSIAGSMIFTIFHEHVLHEVLNAQTSAYSTGAGDFDRFRYTTMLPDQLPPLDLSLVFANEYGAISNMGLYGVKFFQEGMTFSIQDIYSENTVQYMALDFDPLRVAEQRKIDGQGVTNYWSTTASNMTREYDPKGYRTRREPFI